MLKFESSLLPIFKSGYSITELSISLFPKLPVPVLINFLLPQLTY